jgi:hypothetical protein
VGGEEEEGEEEGLFKAKAVKEGDVEVSGHGLEEEHWNKHIRPGPGRGPLGGGF